MIRAFQPADLDRAADLWLAAKLQAHDFIAPEYWKGNQGWTVSISKAFCGRGGTLPGYRESPAGFSESEKAGITPECLSEKHPGDPA